MNPEQIKALIDQLLKSGEILATKAYEISLKQVYANMYLEFFWAILFAILTFFLWKAVPVLKNKGDDANYNEEDLYYILRLFVELLV